MKTLKHVRLAGVLFVIIALIAMMIPVASMADPTTGELLIHKYGMTNTAEATSPGTGNASDAGNVPADAQPLAGITFKIYTVVVDSTTDSQGLYPDTSNGITVMATDGSGNPTQIKDSADNLFNIVSASGTLSTTGVTTDTNGTADTNTIPQGIYLVVEQTPPAALGITSMSAPFVVAVPMANPDGSGWINPVNVYPKNEALAVVKTADKTSVSIGDSVAYTITAGVPADLTGITGYTITDTLDPALTYVSVSDPLIANLPDGTTMNIPSTDYTVDPSGVAIVFNSDGMTLLSANKVVSVMVTLNTTVNENLVTEITAPNTATASFTNSDGTVITSNPSNPVIVHTGTLQVTKADATSGDKLGGAVFKVASSLTNAQNNNFLKTDSDGNILDVGDTGYASATDLTITTDSTGVGSVSGLADLDNSTDPATAANYWVVETTAPQGYNILVTPVQVSFDGADESTNWSAAITVKDTKSFVLPLTGAAGVALFTIIGIVLVGCAVVLTVNLKKKKAALAIH